MMDQAVTRAAGVPSSTTPQAAASARRWAILLTSANHGTVGPLGSTFPHAGEHHERVVVVEVPAGAGAPSDQVNLMLVSAPSAPALDEPAADLKNLARQFERAASRHVPLTISPESCTLLFRAMTTPPDAAPSAPVGAAQSIDTPEFIELLSKVWNGAHPRRGLRSVAGLIAHIDQHVASQVRAVRDELEAQLAECAALSAKWAAAAGDADGRASKARDAALEEAALACEAQNDTDWPTPLGCKAAIRALKARPAISHSGEGATGTISADEVQGQQQ